MIHYHGLPITPDTVAVAAISGGHAFVSYAHPGQLGLAAEVSQSFALDNGAFSAWRSGNPVSDWSGYYAWVRGIARHPAFDWAVIPDVIDGDEAANDRLLLEWPLGRFVGVPVWHLHESIDRLVRLCNEWPRVALGSSGEYATTKTVKWWARMFEAFAEITDDHGAPICKLHGLRMLDPEVFTAFPLSSADSTNIGRNVGIDSNWRASYAPPTKAARAILLRQRIEAQQSAPCFNRNYVAKQCLLV